MATQEQVQQQIEEINKKIEKVERDIEDDKRQITVDRDMLLAHNRLLVTFNERLNEFLKDQKKLAEAPPATAQQAAPPATAQQAGASENTIKSRLRCSAKYCAHIPGGRTTGKQAATVVERHHLATYAHDPHNAWSCNDTVEVAVHASTADRRSPTIATVVYIDSTSDFVLLRVSDVLEPPVLDAAVQAGDPYYVHGQSAQAQADATSISHGIVSATELDANCQIRGDMLSGWGDSGGGVFSVASGKLIGINVANNLELHKAVLVPSAVISYALAQVLPA